MCYREAEPEDRSWGVCRGSNLVYKSLCLPEARGCFKKASYHTTTWREQREDGERPRKRAHGGDFSPDIPPAPSPALYPQPLHTGGGMAATVGIPQTPQTSTQPPRSSHNPLTTPSDPSQPPKFSHNPLRPITAPKPPQDPPTPLRSSHDPLTDPKPPQDPLRPLTTPLGPSQPPPAARRPGPRSLPSPTPSGPCPRRLPPVLPGRAPPLSAAAPQRGPGPPQGPPSGARRRPRARRTTTPSMHRGAQ